MNEDYQIANHDWRFEENDLKRLCPVRWNRGLNKILALLSYIIAAA